MKQKLINYLLGKLVCVITPEDVIKTQKGVTFLGDKQISSQEIRQLQAEIKALENMRLWKVLTETIRYHAVRKSVHEAVNFQDVMAGKMGLWVLGLFSSIIKEIKNK